MDDLITVLQIAARHKGKLLGVAGLVVVAIFLYPRAQLQYVSVSPDRTYRIEMYGPSLYQWVLNLDMEDPGFVRLYRNTDNHYFGESPVTDFLGGADVIWNMAHSGNILVGRDVMFKEVPPVTAWGQVLEIPSAGTTAGEAR
jgi:hypothetical protein